MHQQTTSNHRYTNQLPATLQDSKQTLEDIAKQAAPAPATSRLTAKWRHSTELAASGVDIKHSKATFQSNGKLPSSTQI